MRTSPGTLGAALQTLPRTIELPNAGALESDLGVATASGHHGELLQGPVRLHESIETALVILPDKRWHSRAHGKVTPHTGIEVATTPHKPKVVAAVTSVMDILGVKDARVELSFTGFIPVSRGLGSSTTDMISALRCVGHALDLRIGAAEIARICHEVEGATDPTMFSTPEKLLFLLFASRKSTTLRRFPGVLPDFVVATFDASETMGAVETEEVVFDDAAHHVQRFENAVRNYEKALKTRNTDAPFPAFTHAQPAMPSTFGAYLANVGISVALIGRQVAAMERYFDSCPLGACAGYGTSIPIDPEITAHLLGYTQGPLGSITAVADRSAASLVLGQLAELSTLYSRVAADLQFWSSGAVGLVYFPDNLVGQSSIMPPKRNAFVLENTKVRCASIIAAHMESLVSMKSAPYKNTIEVSSEAISGFSVAVEGYRGIATLVGWHLDGAVPQVDIARQVMRQGNVGATFEAEQAVMRDGVAFREAYNSVRTKMQMPSTSRSVGESSQAVEPAEFGAGPSAVQTRRICNRLGEYREELSSTLEKVRGRVDKSAANLRKEVEELLR